MLSACWMHLLEVSAHAWHVSIGHLLVNDVVFILGANQIKRRSITVPSRGNEGFQYFSSQWQTVHVHPHSAEILLLGVSGGISEGSVPLRSAIRQM